MAIGAAGGAGLVVVNNPDTALTVHVCPAGAFTVIISLNWPFVGVVALFKHTHGSVIVAPHVITKITALPVILLVQPVVEFVATTVYVPAVLCTGKFNAAPVPATGVPTLPPLSCNW